jgi:MtfA peptidase
VAAFLSRLFSRWRRAPELDESVWRMALERLSLVQALPQAEQQRLRGLVARFLADKAFSAAADFELQPWQAAAIAAQACLPCLQLGYGAMRGWHEVIVYPGQFGLRRHHHDEDTGVVSEWDDELAGESWDRGPLILSWADVAADLEAPEEGFNLVLHEIAHKLDALDGAMNGTPPLPDAAARAAWADTMQRAYDALCAEVDAGRETAIDPYAADCPEEFFAVLSEYHWSAPDFLAESMPGPAALLRRFYGPSPFAGRA